MEKITRITSKEFETGVFIELECCMCYHTQTIAAYTKKDLIAKVKEEGWKNLNSDQYQIIGYYCGCDYLD